MTDTDSRKNRIFKIISISILILSAVLSCLQYRHSFLRFFESCRDFLTGIAYWFMYVIGMRTGESPSVIATISEPISYDRYQNIISFDIDGIVEFFILLFKNLFDIVNFIEFNQTVSEKLLYIILYSTLVIPLVYILSVKIKDFILIEKPDSLGETTSLYRGFVWLLGKVKWLYNEFLDLVSFFMSKKLFVVLFAIIWILNFGLVCVLFDFFAFYFYFISSLEASSFLQFGSRLLLDIAVVLKSVPVVVFLVLGAVVYHSYHRSAAIDLLRHNEAKNCGLIKELELVLLIIGEPGKGKTTFMTDLVLSLVNIYKADAVAILRKLELYFPVFDFTYFRAGLIEKISTHEIFCVPDIDDYVEEFYEVYELESASGINSVERDVFGTQVDLGNQTLELKDALVIYGRAFLIYQNCNPVVANYSVRMNGGFSEAPFFNEWDGDFFENENDSYYSHILDSDIMRFGKKVDPQGQFNGSFGYGIWVKTEAAKSYGNQNSNAGYDRSSDEANPLNDLVEYSIAMGRHPNATVDNKVFFRMLMDEQRATDLKATMRELCAIISIEKKGELQLAITGYDWLFKLRDKLAPLRAFVSDYIAVRADFTLLLMLPKLLCSLVELCCVRLENIYGYRELQLIKEGGNVYSGGDGVKKEPEILTWYQSNMKVYSCRFATDCYADFFTRMQKDCGYGIMDYPEYKGLYPTPEEFEAQKDFFIMKMMGMMYGDCSLPASNDRVSEVVSEYYCEDQGEDEMPVF